MIPASFLAALGQLGDPRFRWVLIQGVGLTLLLLFGAYFVVFQGVRWLMPDCFGLPWVGEVCFVEALLSWGSVVLMLILSVFLMVPVASAFTGIFLDDVADAVEERHYSHLPPAPHIALSDNLRESLSFLGVIVLANIAALVLYFTPLAPFVFYGLNGFLLGREYFRMIAVRRLGRAGAKTAYRRNFATIWAAGALMAVPLTVPVVNLLVPILGAATFTHLFHRLEARG
ncbi:MAG: EI24 domain-containing protein [Silicimonas sp.]|nr:EI24 domain-containing protein [Silicimonas sp.]MBT8426096.1 EI24 domain-containing protein [Silicimonas sp.]